MSAYAELNNARDEWEEYEAREAIKWECSEDVLEKCVESCMTYEEAIKHGEGQLKIFGGEHREFIEVALKALGSQITRCYGLVINPNEEPFIIEFKRNEVITVEYVDGVWIAQHKPKEEYEE